MVERRIRIRVKNRDKSRNRIRIGNRNRIRIAIRIRNWNIFMFASFPRVFYVRRHSAVQSRRCLGALLPSAGCYQP